MSIFIEEQAEIQFPCSEDTATTFTIGYENYDIERFVRVLRSQGVQRVIDVRKNPISRKKGFSKKVFSETLKKHGIEYVHLPQLGIPSSYRTELNCQADYDALFEFYETELIPQVMDSVREAADLIREKPSVLVCFEKSPKQCHRYRLAKIIEKIYGFPVANIK